MKKMFIVLFLLFACSCTTTETEYIEVTKCTNVRCILSDNDSLLQCVIEQKKMLKQCTSANSVNYVGD